MDHEEVRTELDQISMRLQEDGLPPGASTEQQHRHLWRQLLAREAKLQAATQELQTLRTQQASEMKEVENYVSHIRGLLEERECRTSDYERDNEHLRQQLHQIGQHQESQSKELAEMLAQEDLGEMGLSSPSEQVAYLLVERATLLERLEAAERRLESQSLTVNFREVHHQEHSHHTMGEELRQQTEDMQKTMDNLKKQCPSQSPWKKLFGLRRSGQSKHNITPTYDVQISQERNERQQLERDLEEASRRLAMAHQDIRRLTNELDAAKNNNQDQSDMMKLQRAKEQNETLDVENTALRERVCTLESENKKILDQEAAEDSLIQMRELQRQLQRLRKEQEELEERNEELEAVLGEAQNASKSERHRHDGELEGLHRRIRGLEAELKKQEVHEKMLKSGEEVKTTESFLQLPLRDSSQERLALLEARLTEEKDWRKQLEVDLNAAQAALKKDKEALQIGEREIKKLRLEVNSLQTECQQGKTLIKSLTQVKGEKVVLEEKVAKMERARSRLEDELERYKKSSETQQNQLQLHQLQEQADRLTAELSSLQTTHNALREEMVCERLQTAELQAKLSSSVQEKLTAEGQRERLELEMQRLKEQLKWHQEQLSVTKETLPSCQTPEHPGGCSAAHIDSGLSPVERMQEECQELNDLQTKVRQERQLASQHQLSLQAQVKEAQARIMLSAELKQVQTKLVQVEQSVHSQAAECERQQQKIKELELQLARSSTNRSTTTSLQEELQAERARLIAVDKKVLDLQLQLKSAQHQLRVEEARAGESSRLERDSRDLSDTLSALRAQQQEEHITRLLLTLSSLTHSSSDGAITNIEGILFVGTPLIHLFSHLHLRKLLEQREEELQQQVRSLRLKEASMSRTNAELSHRAQQLDTRLAILEAELGKAREELECDRQQGELQQVLLQLDTHIRKYNEKKSQHKTKLRYAKQVYLKETAQRDRIIQKLENDLGMAFSLSHKEKDRINTVTEENEKLLEEKRELLRKMSDAEDMGSKGMRTAATFQHRANFLEMENRQLQDRSLKLSNQVSSLERALRNVQSFYSLEVSERAVVDGPQAPVSTQQASEQGYLNLTSPLVLPDTAGSK
ncbi:Coiled-coil domain-containing protein 30 [Liparis tanakae]|uniref:Coiled-coil domain-containing protein 30 n=1 Tax=Liparis tanakae TaxID=230148 RepID=A0A4Z2JD39_9TELE|nr:Coiled-coil domain-containing protein 30 [Liparis tanakae]